MKIVAIYSRVSSNNQREAQTIESQIEALLAYAQEQGYTVVENYIFKDDGYSGSVLVRPGLEKLRDLAAEGEIEIVLVYSPDRLSRKYAYQVVLTEEFARQGVEVIFLKSPKATTPEEELTLQLQGMLAEYERAQILERTRRGKKHRAKCGSVSVLAGAPYGYQYIKRDTTNGNDASYHVIEKEAQVVKKMFRLYTQEGLSLRKIIGFLSSQSIPTRTGKSRWTQSTISGILKNPAYKGKACYGKTEQKETQKVTRISRLKGNYSSHGTSNHVRPKDQWIEIPVPAIISEETFEHAQELFERNKQLASRRTKEPSLLQGLVVCSECSYSLYRECSCTTAKKRIYYYRCRGADNFRFENGRICSNRPIRQDYLEELVWQQIIRLLEEPTLIKEEIDRRYKDALHSSSTQKRKEVVNRELIRVKNGIKKLLDAYQEDIVPIDELRKRIPQLRKREASLNKEIEHIQIRELDKTRFLELGMKIDDFLKCLRSSAKKLDVLERQKVIRLIVKEILVGKDKITIKHSIPVSGANANGLKDKSSYLLCPRVPKSSP
jgi:site-specific DNA recombinase